MPDKDQQRFLLIRQAIAAAHARRVLAARKRKTPPVKSPQSPKGKR